MIIGALLIGLLTAYYFGIRTGVTAAAASALLFFVAAVVPGTTILVYSLVGLFVAGVCWLGPRRPAQAENDARAAMRRLGRSALGKLWRRL